MRNLVLSVTCAAEPRQQRGIEDGLNFEGYAVLWGGVLTAGPWRLGARLGLFQSGRESASPGPVGNDVDIISRFVGRVDEFRVLQREKNCKKIKHKIKIRRKKKR